MEMIMREKYLNPLTDFGFKKLFFNELNKELLIDFLNEIIPEQSRIIDIQYQPTIQLGSIETDRKVVFDIFCTNEKGEYFIIEMQKARQPYFKDRCLFYSSYPIQKQAQQGVWNFKLKAVYTIAILDFILFDEFVDDDEYVIERVYLLRDRTKTRYSDKLSYIFIELPKFKKEVFELETNIDRWLFSLKNLSYLESRPVEVQGKVFEKLFKSAEIRQLTDDEMKEYTKSILEYEDVRDALAYAKEEARKEGLKEGLKEGREEGHEKGRKEGREEGRKKGLEEGREEGLQEGLQKGLQEGLQDGFRKGQEDAKVQIVQKCLKEGFSLDLISQITGLTFEQIKNMSKK